MYHWYFPPKTLHVLCSLWLVYCDGIVICTEIISNYNYPRSSEQCHLLHWLGLQPAYKHHSVMRPLHSRHVTQPYFIPAVTFCSLNLVDIHWAYDHSPASCHVGLYLNAFAWICQLFKTLHKWNSSASFIYSTFSITTDFCSKLVCIWSSLYLVNRNVYGSSHYHGTNCSDISQKYAIWYFCLKFPISEGRGKYIFQ